ncbi:MULTISPECIES: hypothetical protein [Photorhabdus]|uniref:hypothetical protein n=1 Tax=Photorhabdus TaxID=29487 RepID=UPI0011C3ED95|nr:hypothetical protein [Photorhabdus asymbiotica]
MTGVRESSQQSSNLKDEGYNRLFCLSFLAIKSGFKPDESNIFECALILTYTKYVRILVCYLCP